MLYLLAKDKDIFPKILVTPVFGESSMQIMNLEIKDTDPTEDTPFIIYSKGNFSLSADPTDMVGYIMSGPVFVGKLIILTEVTFNEQGDPRVLVGTHDELTQEIVPRIFIKGSNGKTFTFEQNTVITAGEYDLMQIDAWAPIVDPAPLSIRYATTGEECYRPNIQKINFMKGGLYVVTFGTRDFTREVSVGNFPLRPWIDYVVYVV
jgi:hypothetical protein